MFPSRTISLTINAPCAEVYDLLATPANLSRWTGVAYQAPLERVEDNVWRSHYEGQVVTLTFTPRNPHGIVDLQVTGRGAADRCYRTRVFANGKGTELCCTVLQREDETDEQFESECEWLRTDLQVLKSFLEAM